MITNILLGVVTGILFMGGFLLMFTQIFSFEASLKKQIPLILLGLLSILFSGFMMSLVPNYTEEFCESNDGIYDYDQGLRLCSIPDLNGDYEVYKILKIDEEFKLASFAEGPVPNIKERGRK